MILLILTVVQCQELIMEQYREKLFQGLVGYYPYGSNLTSTLIYIQDLCPSLKRKDSIILTQLSTKCSQQKQLVNANGSVALILIKGDEFKNFNIQYYTTPIFITSQENATKLKNYLNQKTIISFKMPKAFTPVLKYVIYKPAQNNEVLRQLSQFKQTMSFDLIAVYHVNHQQDISGIEIPYSDLIVEYVIQDCILRTKSLEQWIDYRIRYEKECCVFEESKEIIQCSQILKKQFLDEREILGCALSGVWNFVSNQIDYAMQIPTIENADYGLLLINDKIVGGNYSMNSNLLDTQNGSSVFRALCDSYLEDIPIVCQFKMPIEEKKGNWVVWIIVVVLFICLSILIGFMLYRRRQLILKDKLKLIYIIEPNNQ